MAPANIPPNIPPTSKIVDRYALRVSEYEPEEWDKYIHQITLIKHLITNIILLMICLFSIIMYH